MAGSSEQTFGPGDQLFAQDDAAERLFVISAGHVRIERRVFKEEITVETIGPGNLCGEVAAAGGLRYPCTATALTEVKALVIERDQIDATLMTNPDVAGRLVRKLSGRVSYLHFRLANLSLRSVEARVMLQLHFEAVRHGGSQGEAFAPIPFDLPDVLAAERGVIDACLREIVAAGLIEFDGNGRFRITDRKAFDRRLSYHELSDRLDR